MSLIISKLHTNVPATVVPRISEPSGLVGSWRSVNHRSISGGLLSVGVSMGMMKACERALWLTPDIVQRINYLWSLNSPRLGSAHKAKVHFYVRLWFELLPWVSRWVYCFEMSQIPELLIHVRFINIAPKDRKASVCLALEDVEFGMSGTALL